MKLVIQRYTREAGVRNLERNIAALARAAAVKVAEQECAVPLSKDMHPMAESLVDTRLADGAEVEMEVITMGVDRHDISNAFKSTSTMVVDEAMLEKVLGVTYLSLLPISRGITFNKFHLYVPGQICVHSLMMFMHCHAAS